MAVRNPLAAWGLGFGIAGLGLLLLSLGSFFLVTLPLSGTAWVLGSRARRRAAEGASSEAQATAALWLGRIGVAIGLLAMIVFIVLVAAGFDFEQLRDDLERELERQRRESETEGVRTAVEGLRATVCGLLGR
jgi:hypothetical protein